MERIPKNWAIEQKICQASPVLFLLGVSCYFFLVFGASKSLVSEGVFDGERTDRPEPLEFRNESVEKSSNLLSPVIHRFHIDVWGQNLYNKVCSFYIILGGIM